MSGIKSLLGKRLKSTNKTEKMHQLAQRSTEGNLSSFSGVFQVPLPTEEEKQSLLEFLNSFKNESTPVSNDYNSLLEISSEIKAINNQAIILHGERIKKAQTILKSYKEGAFSSWLVRVYGNRQTPYNFLQYYEFYSELDAQHKEILDRMPKQVIYTLSSRKVPQEKKVRFIETFQGETKQQLLTRIREEFPLEKEDKRSVNYQQTFKKLIAELKHCKDLLPFSQEKKQGIANLIDQLEAYLHD